MHGVMGDYDGKNFSNLIMRKTGDMFWGRFVRYHR